MNNQYIFYPKMNIDIDKMRLVVMRNLNKPIFGLASHHRKVEDEPYLVEFREQYPFFSEIYNIFPTPAGYKVPIHLDHSRPCALNIPIDYTADSHTIFYDVGDSPSFQRIHERVYDTVTSEATEVFRFTLTQPVIMNTSIPHGVIGGPKRARIILSWSVSMDTSYEELRKLYG